MTSIIILLVVATIIGSLILIVPILAYYWGEGQLPTDPKEKQRLREGELALRAAQIERSKNMPFVPRDPRLFQKKVAKPNKTKD